MDVEWPDRRADVLDALDVLAAEAFGQTSNDVLVEAEVLFGGLDREPSVQALSDPKVELARVATC